MEETGKRLSKNWRGRVKGLIALLLSLIMACSILPGISARADDGFPANCNVYGFVRFRDQAGLYYGNGGTIFDSGFCEYRASLDHSKYISDALNLDMSVRTDQEALKDTPDLVNVRRIGDRQSLSKTIAIMTDSWEYTGWNHNFHGGFFLGCDAEDDKDDVQVKLDGASVPGDDDAFELKKGTDYDLTLIAPSDTATWTLDFKTVNITSMSLDQNKLEMKKGENKSLVLSPEPATRRSKWSSSNTSVATVDETGKVTAVGFGTATITATCTRNESIKATCEVTVPDPSKVENPEDDKEVEVTPVTGLEFKSSKNGVKVSWKAHKDAASYDVYASYAGKKAKEAISTTGTSLTISKIDGKKINTKKDYQISVTAKNAAGKEIGSSVKAIVAGKDSKYANAKSIKISKKSITLKKGKSEAIKATVKYDKKGKAVPKKYAAALRYESSDKSVATVNAKGKVKAKGPGKCVIHVYTQNGLEATVKVKVTAKKK